MSESKELYQLLLLWTALDGGPLAKLIISQEQTYTVLGLSDKTRSIPRASYDEDGDWFKLSIASLMVHREIHPDTKNEDDDAALSNAIKHERYRMQTTRLLMKRLLRKRACDINHQTQEGLTILSGAVAYLPPSWGAEVLEFCLDVGCDANIQYGAGRTPLMIASYRGADHFAAVLLEARCDPNVQDREGGTSVTDIVMNDRKPSTTQRLRLWKERFSPVGGHTALMYAVIVGSVRIVELLLRHGCDTKMVNSRGLTALDFARQFHKSRIVTILEGHEKSEHSKT